MAQMSSGSIHGPTPNLRCLSIMYLTDGAVGGWRALGTRELLKSV